MTGASIVKSLLSQEKKENLSVRVTKTEKDLIKNYAKKNNISNSSVIRIAINNFLQEQEQEQKTNN